MKSLQTSFTRSNPTTKIKKIAFAVALVTPEMLQKIKDNMTRRLNKSIEVEGRHFENMKL